MSLTQLIKERNVATLLAKKRDAFGFVGGTIAVAIDLLELVEPSSFDVPPEFRSESEDVRYIKEALGSLRNISLSRTNRTAQQN